MRSQQQRIATNQPQMIEESQPQRQGGIHFSPGQLLATGGAALASLGLDMATHNVAVVLAGLVGIYAVGKLSAPDVLKYLVPGSDPQAAMALVEQIANQYAPEDPELQQLPQDFISKAKRLFSIQTPPPAQPKDDRDDAGQPMPTKKGNATAMNARPTAKNDDGQQQQGWIPPKFRLDDVLDVIHAFNRKGMVYFGESADGAIVIDLSGMYHVIDISPSGRGKSNRFRLGMMQLVNTCEVYYVNPLANKIKAVNDERKIEVWTPIYERLANGRPVKEGREILALMAALGNEIKAREVQEANDDLSWQDRPIFIFIDELPEVFRRCPKAIDMLDQIGRTGRQFCVFLWIASQTARVEDIGLSTALQAQLKTRIYGGGDKTSADRIMKGSLTKDMERALQSNGAGLTVMLADEIGDLTFNRSPLVTNEALFDYLGAGPFRLADWLPVKIKGAPVKQNLLANLSPDLSREVSQTVSPPLSQDEDTPIHAQDTQMIPVKGESRESVKASQNEEIILDAMDALEREEKTLTLHAIAKRAELTWRQHKEIEEVAMKHGYELVRGQGRSSRIERE